MKTILITGSTDGIGKLTAVRLANDGHQLILHGRNKEKLESTIEEVKAISNNENISGFIADFSEIEVVINMAEAVKTSFSQIDVLINNAGIFKSPISKTKDGFNICFAVNYFAPFVLTHALLPLLKSGDDPRVINLSSAAQAPVSIDALVGNEDIATQSAYAQSKIALTMWSLYLAENEPGITVIAVNPGSLLNTKMVKEAYGRHWSSADKGMNILYDLATTESYSGDSGKYFDNDKGEEKGYFAPAHPDAYDQRKIDVLISKTHELLAK